MYYHHVVNHIFKNSQTTTLDIGNFKAGIYLLAIQEKIVFGQIISMRIWNNVIVNGDGLNYVNVSFVFLMILFLGLSEIKNLENVFLGILVK